MYRPVNPENWIFPKKEFEQTGSGCESAVLEHYSWR
jgi:hypothetical protein